MDIKWQIASIKHVLGMVMLIDKYRDNRTITLREIQEEWTEMYKTDASQYPFYSVNLYITALLSFVVFPKEALFDKLPDKRISELPIEWGLRNKGDITLKNFIRRLRNSISHGNIQVSEALLITFEDINPRDESDKFTISFKEYELRSFVDTFCVWTVNYLYSEN